MDKKFLQEHGLIDAQKQFTKLYEYTYITSDDLTNEADDDENGDDLDDFNMPQQDDNNDGNAVDMDQSNNTNGNDDELTNDDNSFDPNDFQQDDSNNNNQGGVEGLDVNKNAEADADNEISTEQDGDEVIDVDDLTKAQEDSEDKIDSLSLKIDKFMDYINSVDDLINKSNDKIDNLKAEIEKRNPTQIEKLSMQTQNSYPFNIRPEDYWKNKERTSNYRTDDDENGVNQGQYVITKNDVNGDTDWRSISKSLDDDDLHPTIDSIFDM